MRPQTVMALLGGLFASGCTSAPGCGLLSTPMACEASANASLQQAQQGYRESYVAHVGADRTPEQRAAILAGRVIVGMMVMDAEVAWNDWRKEKVNTTTTAAGTTEQWVFVKYAPYPKLAYRYLYVEKGIVTAIQM